MQYQQAAYYRVTLTNHKSVLIRYQGEDVRFFRGIEVDRYGEPVSGPTFDQREHHIEKAVIKRLTPYRLNLHYGELERGSYL